MTAATGTDDPLVIGKYRFNSRLIVGTGKFENLEIMRRAHEASGAEMVTVAVRRVNLQRGAGDVLDYIDPKKFTLLPNTAGCFTADEAVRYARLGREAGMSDLVKLEVIGDRETLFPDNAETVKAAAILVKDGFTVMPYISDDLITAKRLVDLGCPVVMPLGAPIGSGLGIRNPYNIRIIKEQVNVPVIVDAGIGTASDAAIAMELGVDGLLVNTAIATARNPEKMAEAVKLATCAGRLAYQAGRMGKKLYANASSPFDGMISS